jgi:hypothetical protein
MKTLILFTIIFCISFGCSPKLVKLVEYTTVTEIKEIDLSLERWSDFDYYNLNYKDAHYVSPSNLSPDEESIIQNMQIGLGSKESVSDIKKELLNFIDDDSNETITIRLDADQLITFKKEDFGDIVYIYGIIWNNGWMGITGFLTKERLEILFPSELFN